ncbi:uncharacterized protein LY89DRAFT_690119 [Mollisia scopiformis]|uniref:Peptidase M61 catalytic domain-containing protein n=1 Tax=Mollisia scopiformis TaxID=149040 RepID=A0A132BB71_MOLSC|nr:uncharacterized protein LY89DRAFT_690119 [Mollisia scopiformis]KUJ09670.1 hypothetical protein LY89DRAFT_690119 [Mollisia scopiformis]
MPTLKLLLTPSLACEAANQCINVRITLDVPGFEQDAILFHHILSRGPIKTMQYTSDALHIRDALGPVQVHHEDSGRRRFREFLVDRDVPPGELTIEYQALPWKPTETSPCGPQIAIERDGGGLTGAGMAFILRPDLDMVMDITVEWDLSSTPPGTQAACSLGEGTMVSAKVKPDVLDECFFAVGSLHSYPPLGTSGKFGMYWLENPSFDAPALGRQMESLIPIIAAFFHDQDLTYRIFIRRNIQKCVSGRGLYRGFVFAWTTVVPRDQDEIVEFLMHETVHNWPRLGFSGDYPTPEELADGWFNEGIAEYYSIILPYRFGIFSEQELIRRLNIRISGYYTNPDLEVKNKDVQDRFWNGGHVNRIPYQRGFMYFMQLAYKLKKANARSLDNIILDMVDLRRRGKPHGIIVWLHLIAVELGPSVDNEYRFMADAHLIILPSDVLQITESLNWTLEMQRQEPFYLGFPEECLTANPPVVKLLDPDSRAAEAGVREGDVVTRQYSFFVVAERWGQNFSMNVKRKNDEGIEELKTIEWWPRSRETVESYQFVARSEA